MKDLHLSHRQSVACNCKPWPDMLPALFTSPSVSFVIGSIIDEVPQVRTVCYDREARDLRECSSTAGPADETSRNL
jgi:hypothetical protein